MVGNKHANPSNQTKGVSSMSQSISPENVHLCISVTKSSRLGHSNADTSAKDGSMACSAFSLVPSFPSCGRENVNRIEKQGEEATNRE